MQTAVFCRTGGNLHFTPFVINLKKKVAICIRKKVLILSEPLLLFKIHLTSSKQMI